MLLNRPPSSYAQPYGTLLQGSDGCFYGTTLRGGAFNVGTVFKLDTFGTFTTSITMMEQVPVPGWFREVRGVKPGITIQ